MIEKEDQRRLLVLTDIGGDPDDQQSMVRLLLYSDAFDIEGLIATSRMQHGLDTRPELIQELVDAYGQVLPNLRLHDAGYPDASALRSVISAGRPVAGPTIDPRDSFGVGKDTDASRRIIEAVDREDPRPLWITVWGGTADLAQALWRVSQSRSASAVRAFCERVRVYAIGDQDSTSQWIKQTFSSIFYITNRRVFRGMYRGGDRSLVDENWVRTNVNESHGPLGALYPSYDGGDPWATTQGKVRGVKEGDTPSLLYLLNNGLNVPEQPVWGGWGGRFVGANNRYEDAADGTSNDALEGAMRTVYRWRSDIQNSFAARMDRCVKPPSQVNTAPIAVIKGPLQRSLRGGESVWLDASSSRDIKGGALSFRWEHYREIGQVDGAFVLHGSDQPAIDITAPRVNSPAIVHIVLTVTDDGDPPLASYQRVVLTILPD